MVKFKTILLIVVTCVCAACSVNEPAVKVNEENQYWDAFRQAVLDDDKDTIISLTHFPFEVRGPGDSASVKSYEQKDFPAIFEQLVTQPVYYQSSGGAINSKPMRQLIEEKQQITPGDFITPDLIQFIQFEFERIDGQWFFTRAYLEE